MSRMDRRIGSLLFFIGILVYVQCCVKNPISHGEIESWRRCHGYSCEEWERTKEKVAKIKELLHLNDTEDGDETIDGDIWLTPEMVDAMLEAARTKINIHHRQKRKLHKFGWYFITKWPLPILYTFDSNIDDSGRENIRLALSHWEAQTCIRFEERTAVENTIRHIQFTNGQPCASYIGRIMKTPQPIQLSDTCMKGIGATVHEVGHAIGFWHEHQRSDRDDHVVIHPENLLRRGSFANLLSILRKGDTNNLVPYDYGSIMHYNAYASSNGKMTIEPTNSLYIQTIGQKSGLSFFDAKLANLGYCKAACRSRLPRKCLYRGYQDPNNCARCRCPDGFGGIYCDTLASPVNAVCGGHVNVTETDTYVTSPGYRRGDQYVDRTQCTWLLQAPPGHRVVLQFAGSRFSVVTSDLKSKMCRHYVEVRYIEDRALTGPRFCGHKRPEVVLQSAGRQMLILFRANFSSADAHKDGFKLLVRAVRHDGSAAGVVATNVSSTVTRDTPVTPAGTASVMDNIHGANDVVSTSVTPIDTDNKHDTFTGCEAIDVAFVLDSSGNVGSENWRRLLAFVNKTFGAFLIGPKQVQIGVVSYGKHASLDVAFNTSRDQGTLQNEIADLPWKGGWSNTSGGLWVMKEKLFGREISRRIGVPRVCVLVTTGPDKQDRGHTVAEASEARGSGIVMVVVGVTDEEEATDLDRLSSTPHAAYSTHVSSFAGLEEHAPRVVALVRHAAVAASSPRSRSAPTASLSTPTTSLRTPTTSLRTPTTSQHTPTTSLRTPTTPLGTLTTLLRIHTTSLRAPTTSLRTPTTSLRTPTTSLRTPTTSLRTPTTSLRIPTTSLRTPTTSLRILTTLLRIPTTSRRAPTTSLRTPTTLSDTTTTPNEATTTSFGTTTTAYMPTTTPYTIAKSSDVYTTTQHTTGLSGTTTKTSGANETLFRVTTESPSTTTVPPETTVVSPGSPTSSLVTKTTSHNASVQSARSNDTLPGECITFGTPSKSADTTTTSINTTITSTDTTTTAAYAATTSIDTTSTDTTSTSIDTTSTDTTSTSIDTTSTDITTSSADTTSTDTTTTSTDITTTSAYTTTTYNDTTTPSTDTTTTSAYTTTTSIDTTSTDTTTPSADTTSTDTTTTSADTTFTDTTTTYNDTTTPSTDTTTTSIDTTIASVDITATSTDTTTKSTDATGIASIRTHDRDASATITKPAASTDEIITSRGVISKTLDTTFDISHKTTTSNTSRAEYADTITLSAETVTQSAETVTQSADTIARSAETVTLSADTIARSAETVTQSTETVTQSADTIARSAETVTQLTETVTQSADTIARSAETVTQSVGTITQSADTITQSTYTITQSTDTITQSADTITQSTDKITQSTGTITQSAGIVAQLTDNISRSTNTVIHSTDKITQLEDTLTQSTTQTADITTQTVDITTQTADVTTQTAVTTTQTADITTQTADITDQTADITTQTADNTTHTADITTQTADITTHTADTSTTLVASSRTSPGSVAPSAGTSGDPPDTTTRFLGLAFDPVRSTNDSTGPETVLRITSNTSQEISTSFRIRSDTSTRQLETTTTGAGYKSRNTSVSSQDETTKAQYQSVPSQYQSVPSQDTFSSSPETPYQIATTESPVGTPRISYTLPESAGSEAVDVAFLLDSSGSVGRHNWRTLLAFVKDVVHHFVVGPSHAQFATAVFSTQSYVLFHLGSGGNDVENIDEMIDSAKWLGGWSNTSGGIRVIKNAVFSRPGGDRPSVPNVCVLVTDGPSNRDAARTIADAAAAKGDGINMIVVGVTSRVDKNEVNAVASSPREQFQFLVDDFSGLAGITHRLVERIQTVAATKDTTKTAKRWTSETTGSTAAATTEAVTSAATTATIPDIVTSAAKTTSKVKTSATTKPATTITVAAATTTACEIGLLDSWNCDFENHSVSGPWCALTQDKNDNFDWTRQRGPTPSRDTGPTWAQQGDYYIYIEASNPRVEGDRARLFMPRVCGGQYCLTIHFNMFGFHTGSLSVAVHTRRLWSVSQPQGKQWHRHDIDVDLRHGDQVELVAVRGDEFSGDIAVDNIRLVPGSCGPRH